MSFAPSTYPTSLDNTASLPSVTLPGVLEPTWWNDLQAAIFAIESFVGVKPGAWAAADTVVSRIAAAPVAASVLLDYTASTDLMVGTTLPLGTWTDVLAGQAFTTTSATSLVVVTFTGNATVGSASGNSGMSARIAIDKGGATPRYRYLGGNWMQNGGENVGVPLIGVWHLKGVLSVGAHDVRLQVRCTNAGTGYLRASALPDYEMLTMQVLEM